MYNGTVRILFFHICKGNKSQSLGEEMLYFVKLFLILICLLY
ncbi:hypothetical protein HMPREF9445_03111 [Bacteroides clarus YIT 12056]|uniref:Uncharacterized protein n=1 Tax=Bacteroides clarus YIT 12056 TaxID=762984 RepID=A0ABN0CKB0_9BACE|nr:hypothetical protein HMPREF9445_03111 [Bacteroides clarus YIT 12056]